MKVTFVALAQEQLAISLLSAVLRREGHETDLAFHPALFDDRYFLDVPPLARLFDRTDHLIDEIVDQQPDLVAFSVLTPVYQWSLGVAAAVKQRMDVPVIFGGVHPSAVPEICLENACVDYVCVGEGEDALVRLCAELSSRPGRPAEPIPNLWWYDGDRLVSGPAAGFIQDLDALPFFDKEIWQDDIRIADNWMTMTSRGCPYRCTFCFNNFFANLPGRGGGKYLRRRSVGHVIEELVGAKQQFGIRRVDFEDDIFTTSKDWLRDFLAEYRREVDLPFQCLVHPRYIDEDMARWLKEAGCQHVQMGVQSADEDYKRHQLLRMEKDSHLNVALDALHRVGLDTKLDHILGLPGEPISAQEKARELYTQFPPRRVQTFWLTHLPGIELTRSAVENGDLSPEDYERVNRGETGRFHTRSSADAAEATLYAKYETLFRLLPIVPAPIRRRLRVTHIPALPQKVNLAVGAMLETVNVLVNRDAEAFNYVRHYGRQLRRQVPELARDLRHRRTRRATVGIGTSTDRRSASVGRTRLVTPTPRLASSPAGSVGATAPGGSAEVVLRLGVRGPAAAAVAAVATVGPSSTEQDRPELA